MKKDRIDLLLSMMKPYRWSFLNLFLCVVTTSFIAMSYPYIFGLLIDEVFYKKSMDFFVLIVISYGIIFVGEQSLHFVLNAVWSYLSTRFVYDVRRKILRKFMRGRAAYLTRLETGEAIANINQDADEFMDFIHWNVFYVIANSIKVIAALGFIAFTNLWVAGLVAILVPLSFVCNQAINRRAYVKVQAHRDNYGKLSSWLFEMLLGLREIKLFGQSRRSGKTFINKQSSLIRAKIAKDKIEFLSERLNVLLILIDQLLIFIVASFLVYRGLFTVGGLVAALMYFTIISDMFRNLAQASMRMQKNFVSMNRIFSIFQQEEEQSQVSGTRPNNGQVIFRNVNFAYEEKQVLKRLSLEIQEREHIAIVGRSGAGKSSLIQLLQGFYEKNSGDILIGGVPIEKYSINDLRRCVGVVSQKAVIFQGTIRENLTLGNRAYSDDAIWEACEMANIAEAIRRLPRGLDTPLGYDEAGLSGGQLQRLTIARVLLRKPLITVFDEATSALDGASESAIRRLMKELASHTTLISIAHNYTTIAEADRVAVMDGGKIIDSGTIPQLLERCSVFRELYGEQVRWYNAIPT